MRTNYTYKNSTTYKLPISTYGSIDINEFQEVIERLKKIPNYDDLIKDNNKKQQEIARLNNIISELEKDINVLMNIIENNDIECTTEENDVWEKWYFKLKELRGDSND